MKCLAVNTATTVLSVALTDGPDVLHLFETPETRDQGNIIIARIQDMLAKSGLSYADLDLLAAVTGPGSFTGIRIGLAAARGIGLAAGKPVAGVDSFDMFAVPGVANVVAVESWREELYFRMTGPDGRVLIEPVSEKPEDFVRRLDPAAHAVLSGDAAAKLAPLLPAATVHTLSANAAAVARIAASRPLPEQKPVPLYVRGADISTPRKNQAPDSLETANGRE